MSNSRIVPNADAVGGDLCVTPIQVTVPMVLIDNGRDKYWHPETMDRLAADRLVDAISAAGCGGSAVVVEVPIVLPAANQIDDILNEIACQPIRVEMTESHNAFADDLYRLVKEQWEKTGKSREPKQRPRCCR